MTQQTLLEHFFRHEYGYLVASLVRRVGVQHIELVEDSIQWALTQALLHWSQNQPDNPSGWLYKVALRHLLSQFSSDARRRTLLTTYASLEEIDNSEIEDISLPSELTDSLLRMLFITCHQDLPTESQLVFTLKSLGGFSTSEVAIRLFISEANVHKRYSRAKDSLKHHSLEIDGISDEQMAARLTSVHQVLYLLFTEGYLSSHADFLIRKDLCEEAFRLALLLCQSRLGNKPESHALVALMLFNLARLNAREDESGIVLLAQQNRENWDQQQIIQGLGYLNQSAQGEQLSRYHLEASIAAEHCIAPTFEQTRWDRIANAYDLLINTSPSPFHQLNKAIAIAQWKGPEAGLVILETADTPHWLTQTYHWYLVHADLQYRCEQSQDAEQNAKRAIDLAPSEHIKKMIKKRLGRYTEEI